MAFRGSTDAYAAIRSPAIPVDRHSLRTSRQTAPLSFAPVFGSNPETAEYASRIWASLIGPGGRAFSSAHPSIMWPAAAHVQSPYRSFAEHRPRELAVGAVNLPRRLRNARRVVRETQRARVVDSGRLTEFEAAHDWLAFAWIAAAWTWAVA